jgi:hypothetical protein
MPIKITTKIIPVKSIRNRFHIRKGYYKLEEGQAAKNNIIGLYRASAQKRGYAWELSDEEATVLITSNCYYCNREPYSIRRKERCNGTFTYNGIDRIENNIGYTILNSVSCCEFCNRAKITRNTKEFLEGIIAIYEFLDLDKNKNLINITT